MWQKKFTGTLKRCKELFYEIFLLLFRILLFFNMINILGEELKEILIRFINDTKLQELWTPSRVERPWKIRNMGNH